MFLRSREHSAARSTTVVVSVLSLLMLLQGIAYGDDGRAPSASPSPSGAGIQAPAASTAVVPPAPPRQSRFNYSADIASGFPFGDIGPSGGLLGSVDAGLTYHITPTASLQAQYFETPFYPVGQVTTLPLYVKGNPTAIGSVNLQKPAPFNNNVKAKFISLTAHKVFVVGHQAIIITPGYASNLFQHDDATNTYANGTAYSIKLRSFQNYFALVTLPLIADRKFFFAVSGGPQWLVRLNGPNQNNHAQLFYSANLAYNLDRRNSLFFEPARYPFYTPADIQPEYLYTQIYGLTHIVTPHHLWFQLEVQGYSPSARKIYLSRLTCLQASCASVVPTIEADKSAQIMLKFGIGEPQFTPI